MLHLDASQGINLKFKVNLTGTTFEQISAWATVEPSNSDISYQIPASIEDGVLVLKSSLENLPISEKGVIKIKAQHGNNLLEVWSSEYQAVEKVQIVLEQIKEEKIVSQAPKVVQTVKDASSTVSKPKPTVKTVEKIVEKAEAKSKIEKVVEKKPSHAEKIFKFGDFK